MANNTHVRSGNGNPLHSGLAVDGCRDTDVSNDCCSVTLPELPQWWSVDLQGTYDLWSVTILNRKSDHCK